MLMKQQTLRARGSFDHFLCAVAHFEQARDLILSQDVYRGRMALVILHSILESNFYWVCQRAFEKDAYYSRILPAEYSAEERRRVLKNFEEKVRFAEKEKLIDPADASILATLNYYRNAAYHRDEFNPRIVLPFARLVLHSSLAAFRSSFLRGGALSTSAQSLSKEQSAKVRRYNPKSGYINYESACALLQKRIATAVPASQLRVRAGFLNDLRHRLGQIREMRREELYSKTRKAFDETLKRASFEAAGIEEQLFTKIREIRYRLGDKTPGKEVSREEYIKAEQDYHQKVLKAYKDHKPAVSSQTIRGISDRCRILKQEKSLNLFLTQYAKIDAELSEVEFLIRLASARIDEAIQHEIDVARGK